MMSEKEKWLEVNTFYCERLRCRLTPEQCEANRARPRLKEAGRWLESNRPPMPGPCEKCTEWRSLCKEVYQRRKEEAMGKVGVCKNCGEERHIKARGLCSKCYQKLKEEGKLPTVEKPGPKKALRVVVDFGVCPVLYERLKERADEEMQPLATQIVWELKKAFGLYNSEKVGGTV